MKVAREVIVRAARELFRQKGYVGASMQDLADSVGLKKASLYMRFPNKEALVPEVLDLTVKETFSHNSNSDRPWNIVFEELVRGIANTLVQRERCVGLHLAYGASDDTPVARDAVRSFFQSHRDELSGVLLRAMPVELSQAIATDTMARLEGATIFVAVFGEADAMERAVTLSLGEAARAAAGIS